MSKLGVDVGDEFPAEEIRRDENGTVHHHHYHYRRRYRGPFGLLRIFLVIMLFSLAWRLMNFVTYPFGWHGYDRYGRFPFDGNPIFAFGGPFLAFGGTMLGIVVISAALWFLRNRDIDSDR